MGGGLVAEGSIPAVCNEGVGKGVEEGAVALKHAVGVGGGAKRRQNMGHRVEVAGGCAMQQIVFGNAAGTDVALHKGHKLGGQGIARVCVGSSCRGCGSRSRVVFAILAAVLHRHSLLLRRQPR